ncbi:c-type cytochrome biogenesis protein CcmI [Aliidiomarina maris]|uniref:C-type cytochrome biogenesis protein CcmI n=1 Tax=Aliidiomarina maris TaxID=531312 RepID=A0A327X2L0_9GAMM|nr:c-type cytochrome biogenesis protein CcmI [Aliidiomarina maris]RAK00781.1 cytochrome c-type biogenesis protein CcmI [Aliidiomarina maris]RUO27224.1 c-type cytochrome biogenesis protein CcmI [Aliidiomarina maris]
MWYAALAILLIGAVALLLLVKRQQRATYGMHAANRELYQSRLSELESERAEGTLSDADYEAALLELKKTFVADNADEERPITEQPAGMLVPVVALVGLSLVLYFWVGDSWRQQQQADTALAQLPALSERIMGDASAEATQEEVELFALGLRQRLQQDPDAGAWMLYGRVMMQMRQVEQGIDAFERSLALDPNRTSTLIAHAQALIMMGSDNELAQAARNIRRVLENQATNVEALGLLGIIAYERGDFEQAAQAWRLTLRLLDESDPRYASIQRSLESAEQRASGELMFITVTVDISDELRNEMPPHANIFVFVRDPDGQRAPAAVVRQGVSDLPVTLTLTEEDAMVDGHTLATIDSWLVSARLTVGDTIDVVPGVMEARPRLVNKESGQQIRLTISEMH